MNYLRNWMWLLLGCVLPLCAAAQTALVQLEVVPQTLELSSCADGAHLLVIARNPSNIESASDLELKTFADVPIQLQPGTAGAKKLKSGENISWDFKVTCTSGFSTGSSPSRRETRRAGEQEHADDQTRNRPRVGS